MGIFRYRVLVYNTDQNEYGTVSASYFAGRMKITGIFQQPIIPDPEDIVVVNIPWDIIQTVYVELPPMKNIRERNKIAELEIRRLMDIHDELSVSTIPSLFGKTLVFFVKKSDYVHFKISKNINFEPDVAYPNIFSELLLLRKFPGYWLYLVLGKTLSGIVVMHDQFIINTRIFDFSVDDINSVIKEETGFALDEIETSGNVDLLNTAQRIIESLSSDILARLERELIISINTTEIEKITINQVSGIMIVCDSTLIRNNVISSQGSFEGKFSEPDYILSPQNRISLSDLGLLYRGGLEIGKVKSIKW
ncbi:MAG: hypothetical protein ACPL3B_00070 [Fervidobacterium sp.]